MMNQFYKLWSWISNVGISKNISISAIKRFRLSNQLVFISLLLTLLYCLIYVFWNIPKAVALEMIFSFLYVMILVIARLGYSHFSKMLFIGILNIHMFCLSLCFGEASQVHLLFIPVSVIPLVLFDFRSFRTIISFILFSVSIYLFLFTVNFSSPLATAVAPGLTHVMRILFNITAIFCEIIIVYTFINSYDRAEKKLDESNILLEQQFENIFDNSYDALFLVDSGAKKIIRANKRAVELFEMDNETEFYSFNGTDFHKIPLSKKESDYMLNEVLTKGIYNGEVIYKTKKNNEFWGALAIQAMFIGGKRYQSVRVADITVQKEYEKKIKASLNEKEILLSEIHHRVKNNMAVISGLLGLQSSYIEDEKAKELFEESRNRIHSMAMIHDKLYQHETFANIDFSSYINDLVNHIKNSYISADVELKFSVICNDVFLDIKNAVPCGLILNELISNSCKHAFKGRSQGEIKIVCTKMGEKFTMMVSDDGVGFDAEIKLGNPDSLGLTLVKALVDQINGTVKTTYHNGTTYYLSFEA